MHSWKEAEVVVWTEAMLRQETPHLVSFLLMALGILVSDGESRLRDISVLLIPTVLMKLLFAGIKRVKSSKARFRASFTYFQAIQTFLLVRGLISPTTITFDVYASAVLMIQHELTPLHSPLVNACIIAKNSILWGLILNTQGTRIDIHVVVAIFWSFFHLFNYLHVKKQSLMNLFQRIQGLQREQQRLKVLLQAIPDGVAVVTANSQVVAYNQAILTQLRLAEGTGTSEDILRELRSLHYLKEFMERKTAETVLGDLVTFIERKDSSEDNTGVVGLGEGIFELRSRHCLWDSTPACVIIVRDISHWVNLERKAQRENMGKTALLRSVSHELRTPANAILNLTRELLDTERLSEGGVETLQMVTSATHFLLSIINDLLDYSRIITGNFRLSKQLCNLRDIVTDTIQLIHHQCRNKGLALSLFYDSLLPEQVHTDPTRVKQVLLNLLSNALKFTLRGSIEVSALLNAGGRLTIRVKDTGIGIPASDIGKIFRLFGKLEGYENLNPQGCGLGLSISNHIVKSLGGGHISVQSKVGKGSVFAFDVTFDLDCTDKVPTLPDPATDVIDEDIPLIQRLPTSILESAQDNRIAQVLIVDDSDFNRIVARRMIETQGFSCEEAVTGLQALNQVRKLFNSGRLYKLILMDVEMPEMDGMTATREIRSLLGSQEQPMIVGCSAYSSPEDRESSLAAGMDHYLEKPLQREQLFDLLAHLAV